MNVEAEKAFVWDNPQGLIQVEEKRYPYQRAIGKIVADTLSHYLTPGSIVLEVGSGLGYLKSFLPNSLQARYYSTDFSERNLREGLKRREMEAVVTSAYNLPFADSSVNCVLNLDAYDTLPNLNSALLEARRTLMPGGVFVHFQVNHPSEDTVWDDFPNYVFFPPRIDTQHVKRDMVGVKKEDLAKDIYKIDSLPFRDLLRDFLIRHDFAYTSAQMHKDPKMFADMVNDTLDTLVLDRLVIPSVPDYFKAKLENTGRANNLQILESGFRGTSFRGVREPFHNAKHNYFTIAGGISLQSVNTMLLMETSEDVIETASILTFVAQKAA